MVRDLRTYINDLKKAGELIEINSEVDCDYEISAFEVMSARVGGPAFLFNNIKGVQGGRVLVGHFAGTAKKPHRRIAMALGMDYETDYFTFFQNASKNFQIMLKPVEVATGPCKEVIKMGKEVNLLEYPFTYHAIGDAGKYILHNVQIIKDPDSEWINSGQYSLGLVSRNRLVTTPYSHSNFVLIYTTKYELRNQPMPIAIALGAEPAVALGSCVMLPPGVSEYDFAGGLLGTPVELVRAETSDLLVPAHSEMIIEGEVRPYERLPEGPKIESFCFSVGPRQPLYAIRVNCITHRENPVICDLHTSRYTAADSIATALNSFGYNAARKASGLPVKMCTSVAPHKGGMTIFAIKEKTYASFMQDMFDRALGQPLFSILPHQGWVDGEVDIFDLSEIIEAVHTQSNPFRDWIRTSPAYPQSTIASSWMEPDDTSKYFKGGTIVASKLIIDATTKEKPPMGIKSTGFETLFPDETQKWVIDNWHKLGFKEEVVWKKAWREAKL